MRQAIHLEGEKKKLGVKKKGSFFFFFFFFFE